jgi:hypothetical protein
MEGRQVVPALMAVSPAKGRCAGAASRTNDLDPEICGKNLILLKFPFSYANSGDSIALICVEWLVPRYLPGPSPGFLPGEEPRQRN